MAKFELFQRLNTGGSMLSDQEVRNSILVMMNRDLYRWLRELSKDPNFSSCVALSERAVEEQYDMELVLRFIVFRTMAPASFKNLEDIGEFLTDMAKLLAQDKAFDTKKEESIFRETFALLASSLGDDAFRRYDPNKKKFVGGFLVSAFEAVAIGIAYNTKKIASDPGSLIERVKEMWSDPEFVNNSGSGVRASSRIPKIIPFGRSAFSS